MTRMLTSASEISIRLGAGTLGDGMSCAERVSAGKPAGPPTLYLKLRFAVML